jgi:hypothetical protein
VILDPNPSNAATGDIVVGKWKLDSGTGTYSFDPADPAPDAVQVRARVGESSRNAPLQLFFGSLFGQSIGEGGRPALAHYSGTDDPYVLVLSSSASDALSLAGSARLDVGAGTIQVDSSNSCGVNLKSGSSSLFSQATKVVGGSCTSGTITGQVATGAASFADPLRSIPEPTTAGLPSMGAITAAGTYSPGYYDGGIKLTSGTASLLPGIYVIGSATPAKGVSVSASGIVDGDGVMLFLLSGASLSTTGANAGLRLTPPTTGTYAGITIFQARNNAADASFAGNGTHDMEGIVYLPASNLSVSGSGAKKLGRLIVDQLTLSGSAIATITGVGPTSLGQRRVSLCQ